MKYIENSADIDDSSIISTFGIQLPDVLGVLKNPATHTISTNPSDEICAQCTDAQQPNSAAEQLLALPSNKVQKCLAIQN